MNFSWFNRKNLEYFIEMMKTVLEEITQISFPVSNIIIHTFF